MTNPYRHAFVPYNGLSYIDTQGQQFQRRIACDSGPNQPRTIIRSPDSEIELHLNRKIFRDILAGRYDQREPCS